MLYNKHDVQTYEKDFKKKFTNFCEKSPILLSFSLTPTSVQVIDESKDFVYEFNWDFTIPVKEFIFTIKKVLVENCYPKIIRIEEEVEPLSIKEQTKLIEEGYKIDSIPTTKNIIKKVEYLIDKVIVYRDIFIIRNLLTEEVERYKLNNSSIFFLKKIRNGKFTPEEAGSFFFDNATFLNKIGEQCEEEKTI